MIVILGGFGLTWLAAKFGVPLWILWALPWVFFLLLVVVLVAAEGFLSRRR